ncbi:hypothetical protein [Calycomorphotria hydatis]|uniref:Carboxypeptidase regulatory-like domain-containing protein n=1 Tax=Calycomorphotria hydatis TaxID=2528027 RepID=A0A517TAR7_9PLAN|nr:hypothetical protein [Calycomorphotria hydatis]QDT65469.1 hypothetical protein V22_27230 [Calycomorphotria hydatis]
MQVAESSSGKNRFFSVAVFFRRCSLCEIIAATIVLTLFGCGPPSDLPPMFPIQGEVTFNDEPLVEGAIIFLPANGIGMKVGAHVKDGIYSTEVPEGIFNVSISAPTDEPTSYIDDGEGNQFPEFGEKIPSEYNAKTSLQVVISPEKKTNHMNFNLEG